MTDYTQYEYQDLVDDITEKFQGVEGWGDAYQSSMGQTLIQLLADTTDSLHYIQERRIRESYLETAQLRSSILALAGSTSYRPRRKISANGMMKISLKDDEGNEIAPEGNIFIPKMTKMTFGDNDFVIMEDILLTPETPQAEFFAMEGTPQSFSVDPSEDNTLNDYNYVLMPSYDDMEDTSVVVKDSEGEWRDVRQSYDDEPYIGALTFLEAEDRYYDIIPVVGGMRIIFGNDNFGKKPDSEIAIEWIKSSGTEVNITKTGVEFAMEDSVLQDDINVTPPNEYEYTITNITPITGALDEESTEDIRIRAMEYNKTGDRSVTREDFNHMIIRSGIGGIVDFNTYGEQELGINLFRMNHLFGAYLTIDGSKLTQQQETMLRSYVERYAVANPHLSIIPATTIEYQYNLKIAKHPSNRVSNYEIYDHVRTEIAKQFEISNGTIGKPFYHSDMWEFINSLTITKNNITYKVAKYIDLHVNPVYKFESPLILNRAVVKFNNGQEGDVYSLVINGEEYAYTLQIGETRTQAIEFFKSNLASIVLVTENEDGDELTLTAPPQEWFTISSDGTTPGRMVINQIIQIPPRYLNNTFDIDQIVRNSLKIMDSDYNVVLNDDGLGNLVNGSNSNVGRINYRRATLDFPVLDEGEYYVTYQEDGFKNIKPNDRTYVRVLQPKATYEDENETLSTIEFI